MMLLVFGQRWRVRVRGWRWSVDWSIWSTGRHDYGDSWLAVFLETTGIVARFGSVELKPGRDHRAGAEKPACLFVCTPIDTR